MSKVFCDNLTHCLLYPICTVCDVIIKIQKHGACVSILDCHRFIWLLYITNIEISF